VQETRHRDHEYDSCFGDGSVKTVEKIVLMEHFIRQENDTYWVPKTKTLAFLKLNPEMKFDKDDFHMVSFERGAELLSAFHCDCVWGTYRDGHPEPTSRYCSHVMAVIMRKVNNKEMPEYWLREIVK
jgi:hypothetical protein